MIYNDDNVEPLLFIIFIVDEIVIFEFKFNDINDTGNEYILIDFIINWIKYYIITISTICYYIYKWKKKIFKLSLLNINNNFDDIKFVILL